jgi:alpha-ribazole phosphatase
MIFIRHPRPDIAPNVCYGRLDIGVAADGPEQIARALATTPRVRRILASPARRCRDLALALAGRDGLTPLFDERLWEMDMGTWEGMAWADIPRESSAQWLKDPFTLPTPGGECFADLQRRVLAAVADADAGTLVVCHAGPIRAVQMAWQGLTFREAFASVPGYAEPIALEPPSNSERR